MGFQHCKSLTGGEDTHTPTVEQGGLWACGPSASPKYSGSHVRLCLWLIQLARLQGRWENTLLFLRVFFFFCCCNVKHSRKKKKKLTPLVQGI